MLKKFCDRKAAHFARSRADRSSVVNDHVAAIGRASVREPEAAADEDHGVIRRILLELAVEENIAGTGRGNVSRKKKRIELFQGLGVGEFREGSVLQIFRQVGSWPNAKERCAERGVRVTIFFEGWKSGGGLNLRFAEPACIVRTEGVPVSIAEKRGTVVDFPRDFVWRPERLKFGNQHKPAAECILIGGRVEPKEVWSAVGETIIRVCRGLGVAGQVPHRAASASTAKDIRGIAIQVVSGAEKRQNTRQTDEKKWDA